MIKNRNKIYSMRKSRLQYVFKLTNFWMRKSRLQRFFKLRTWNIFTQIKNLCCKTYEKMLIISKNFDIKEKTRVKNSKFKICETNFVCEMNSSKIQIKQIRNIKSIISWNQQFRYINKINATTIIVSIFAHMRQLMCTLHLRKRIYNKFFKK